MNKRIKIKKLIISILIILILLFITCLGFYSYRNNQIIDKYANGYKKNVFDDYCHVEDGYTYAVHPIPLLGKTGNLSIAKDNGNVDAVIWFDLFGKIKEIGIVITTDKNNVHQIPMNNKFEVTNLEDSEIVNIYEKEINTIKILAEKEWGI